MIHASTYGNGRKALAEALFTHKAFRTGGAFKGEEYGDFKPSRYDSGRLAGDDLAAFILDLNSITYVVYSYATPIAWVTRSADGTPHVHRVEQKFSPTTSKHQGLLYMLTHDAR
jgi:hypothetical protein